MKFFRTKKIHGLKMTLLLSAYIFFIMVFTLALLMLIMPILAHFNIVLYENGVIPIASFAIIFILVGTSIAALSSNIPLGPFNRLIEATNKLATGDFSVRLHVERPQEFKKVAESFNYMVEELSSIELLRNDFINNFSHEFKTPIISIQGFAKLLKDPNLSEEEKNEYLNIIIAETKRLSDLSNSILYLSKVEVLPRLNEYNTYNLTEQIRQTVVMFMEKIEDKHMEIELDGIDYKIEANEELMKQVFINLMDNAIKFSNEYSTIYIGVDEKDSNYLVTISNDGVPLNTERLNRIYDKFYQDDNSRKTTGNGLGLALVKKILILHSAEIEVKAQDSQTTFTLTLPKTNQRTQA